MSQRPGRKTSCARCRAGVLRITPFHCLFKVCAASIQRFSSSHGGELQVQKLRIEILPHTRNIQHLHILLGFQVRGAAVPSSNSDLLRRRPRLRDSGQQVAGRGPLGLRICFLWTFRIRDMTSFCRLFLKQRVQLLKGFRALTPEQHEACGSAWPLLYRSTVGPHPPMYQIRWHST